MRAEDGVTLSIITPAYEPRPEDLMRAATSFDGPLPDGWEWIIVLHNTESMTAKDVRAAVARAGSADASIRVLTKKDSIHSPSSPRNAGLEAAGGTYLYFLDHDDTVRKDFLLRGVEKMERDGIDILIGAAQQETADPADSEQKAVPVPLSLDFPDCENGYMVPDDPEIRGRLLAGAPMMLGSKLFRRSLITDGRISFAEDIRLMEDVLFTLRCCVRAEKICVMKSMTAYTYMQHCDSLFQSMLCGDSFSEEDYLIPIGRITDLALKNGFSPGAYLHSVMGMVLTVYRTGKMADDRKRRLLEGMQRYLPLLQRQSEPVPTAETSGREK